MNKTLITAALLCLSLSASQAFASSDCEAKAAEKKLNGAAKTSFVKKCDKDTLAANPAAAACDKSAADRKLSGAAKTSHIKKCIADGSSAKP